ncbi:MAG: competence protein CoiA family protein, partial [Limosilactobacillus sp.]
LEVYLPQINQRPDLLLTDGKRKVAIEFQCSPLSLRRLRERNAGYQRCGIYFHWLLGAPYQCRRLQAAKIAQFTQKVGGRPVLLFWDTRIGRLLVAHDLARCSFVRRPLSGPSAVIKYQMRRLNALQYGRGQCPAPIHQLAIGHPLAACPLVCHDLTPSWPTLDEPVILWRIWVVKALVNQPLFQYWSANDWLDWIVELTGDHWLGYGCIDAAAMHHQLIAAFTDDLLRARVLLACPGGYLLFRYPRWFNNLQEKMNLLDRGGFLQTMALK